MAQRQGARVLRHSVHAERWLWRLDVPHLDLPAQPGGDIRQFQPASAAVLSEASAAAVSAGGAHRCAASAAATHRTGTCRRHAIFYVSVSGGPCGRRAKTVLATDVR